MTKQREFRDPLAEDAPAEPPPVGNGTPTNGDAAKKDRKLVTTDPTLRLLAQLDRMMAKLPETMHAFALDFLQRKYAKP